MVSRVYNSQHISKWTIGCCLWRWTIYITWRHISSIKNISFNFAIKFSLSNTLMNVHCKISDYNTNFIHLMFGKVSTLPIFHPCSKYCHMARYIIIYYSMYVAIYIYIYIYKDSFRLTVHLDSQVNIVVKMVITFD